MPEAAAQTPTPESEPPEQRSAAYRFVERVTALARGERAMLKRNAGNTLAEARGCSWFYRLRPGWDEEVHFLIATLVCTAREPKRGLGRAVGFGRAMAELAAKSNREGMNRRFGVLLDSQFGNESGQAAGGELAFRLRQLVKLADANEIAVPWVSLLEDLLQWGRPDKRVQKKWARDYFQHEPNNGASTGGTV